jgi:hypothetical protein
MNGMFLTLRRVIIGCVIVANLLLVARSVVWAQEGVEWKQGAIVGLKRGTCIREGPGLGYRAHTKVPEDNWAVLIIDGPRSADGYIWWDTSRKAAGDPSGGTGWVRMDQNDTDCFPDSPKPPPAPLIISEPSAMESPMLDRILDLWSRLPSAARAVIGLVGLVIGLRFLGTVASWVLGLAAALISSVFVWILMDASRAFWEPLWSPLAYELFGPDVPDLALLIAALPLISWIVNSVRRLV